MRLHEWRRWKVLIWGDVRDLRGLGAAGKAVNNEGNSVFDSCKHSLIVASSRQRLFGRLKVLTSSKAKLTKRRSPLSGS